MTAAAAAARPSLSSPFSQTLKLQFWSATHPRAAMNTRLLAAMLVVMGLLLYATPLVRATYLRNLTGTVQDQHHEPLNGAVVEIENENTRRIISYITDRSGRYSFTRIQGEVDYRVWFTYRGQRSRVRELSQFDDHQNATINLMVKSLLNSDIQMGSRDPDCNSGEQVPQRGGRSISRAISGPTHQTLTEFV
jgi:hypothetical protein